MRKNQFSGYQDLKREGKQLERRYAEWKRFLACTREQSPEIQKRFRILCECIEKQRIRVLDEQIRIETRISQIPDSLLRQIFTLRYLEGLSWQFIAQRIGGGNEDSIRMMHQRYLRRLEQEKTEEANRAAG